MFQVRIQQVNAAFNSEVKVVESGRGYVTASYELEGDVRNYKDDVDYLLSIKYCKDLVHYPPYGPADNTLCDLDRRGFNFEGVHIRGSPYDPCIAFWPFFAC